MFFPLAFMMPGPFELTIIAGVVLLLFGNRLPGAMRSLGRSVVEFKKGISGIEEELEDAVNSAKPKDSPQE